MTHGFGRICENVSPVIRKAVTAKNGSSTYPVSIRLKFAGYIYPQMEYYLSKFHLNSMQNKKSYEFLIKKSSA